VGLGARPHRRPDAERGDGAGRAAPAGGEKPAEIHPSPGGVRGRRAGVLAGPLCVLSRAPILVVELRNAVGRHARVAVRHRRGAQQLHPEHQERRLRLGHPPGLERRLYERHVPLAGIARRAGRAGDVQRHRGPHRPGRTQRGADGVEPPAVLEEESAGPLSRHWATGSRPLPTRMPTLLARSPASLGAPATGWPAPKARRR